MMEVMHNTKWSTKAMAPINANDNKHLTNKKVIKKSKRLNKERKTVYKETIDSVIQQTLTLANGII